MKRVNIKWDNPTTKADLEQARQNLEKIIQNEMNNHWKHFQNETAGLPQNKFWKKITNLINDKSQQAVQPII